MPSKVTKKRELKVVSEKFQSDIYIYINLLVKLS